MVICISREDDAFFRIVHQTAEMVEKLVIDLRFPIVVDLGIADKKSWVGQFTSRKNLIYIDRDYWYANKNEDGIKKVMHTLCHEIGHAVHFNYLAEKPQYLERAHKGSRRYHCNLNSKESFASCFADYCFAIFEDKFEEINKSKRLSKMGEILQDIVDGDYKVLTKMRFGEFVIEGSPSLSWKYIRYEGIVFEKGIIKLANPFADKLKQSIIANLVSSRIDEIGLDKECSDACIRAGYEYVSDFASKENIEKIKTRRIGKRNVNTVVEYLRRCGVEGI